VVVSFSRIPPTWKRGFAIDARCVPSALHQVKLNPRRNHGITVVPDAFAIVDNLRCRSVRACGRSV